MAFRVLWLAVLSACTQTVAPPAPRVKPRVVTVAPKPPPVTAEDAGSGVTGSTMQVSGGAAVPVQLRFYTVSGLHQGFFSRARGVQKLGEGLGACTDQAMTVDVSWAQAKLEGRIIGLMPTPAGPCVPTLDGDSIDLTPMLPMSKALATWRNYVAGTSDLRINAFKVGMQFGDDDGGCLLLAGGQHPVDGTTFQPCLEVGADKVCAVGEPGTRLMFDDPSGLTIAKKCFGI